MKIPLFDIKREHREILKEIKDAIEKVIERGDFILGKDVREFEEELSRFLKVKYAVGVSSGTEALFLSLKSLGIKEGDEVITTPFTFISTVEVILRIGAKPVFVDVDEETLLMDVDKIEEKITRNSKAIIPVHLYGNVCNMDKIFEISKKYNLKIIEDCAQSFGSKFKEKFSGTFGDCGCFSFFPAKNLGCFGDGGAVVTDDKEVYEKLILLRNHGSISKYEYKLEGYNARLDTIQAAILRVKLKYISKIIDKRRKVAWKYYEELKEIKEVKFLKEEKDVFHSYNYFTIKVERRDQLKEYLRERGIATAIYYPESLHLLEIYKHLGYKKEDFPVSEKVKKEVLSLPVFSSLRDEEIEYICENIKKFYGN